MQSIHTQKFKVSSWLEHRTLSWNAQKWKYPGMKEGLDQTNFILSTFFLQSQTSIKQDKPLMLLFALKFEPAMSFKFIKQGNNFQRKL